MTDRKSQAAGIEPALVRELAAILRETGLTEIEVERGDLRLRISRANGAAPFHAAHAPQPGGAPAPPPAPVDQRALVGAVHAPMVGTAYLAPKPDEPPFVQIGDVVSEGQTLMVIEAMKTFNPIPAPRAGRVTQVLVSDQQPVEFGQALIVLE
jgi:acetyl-CoA carboxylase biotin carboxyl carrier protein